MKKKHFSPQTAAITKALLFIRSFRPDIHNVDFLKENNTYITQLAEAYENNKDEAYDKGIELLKAKQPVSLSSIKKSCENALMNYIQSRGSLNEKNIFRASTITKYFKNVLLTGQKVAKAQEIIKTINNAKSLTEIAAILESNSKDSLLTKGFNSKFGACLGLCKMISQVPASAELTHTNVNSSNTNFSKS